MRTGSGCDENGHLVATKLLALVFFNDVFLENMSSDFIWSPDIKQIDQKKNDLHIKLNTVR